MKFREQVEKLLVQEKIVDATIKVNGRTLEITCVNYKAEKYLKHFVKYIKQHPEEAKPGVKDIMADEMGLKFDESPASYVLEYNMYEQTEDVTEATKKNDMFGWDKVIDWKKFNSAFKKDPHVFDNILNQIDNNKKNIKTETEDEEIPESCKEMVHAVMNSCNYADEQSAWEEIKAARQSYEENVAVDPERAWEYKDWAMEDLGIELDYMYTFLTEVPYEKVEVDDEDEELSQKDIDLLNFVDNLTKTVDECSIQETNEFGEHKFTVYFWPFAGYSLYPVEVEAFGEQEALEKAVAQLEKEGKFAFFADEVENPDDDETLLYVDATEFGGGTHYISSENLKIVSE